MSNMYVSKVDLNEVINTFIPTGLKHRENDTDSREGVLFAVRNKHDFNANGSVRGFVVTTHGMLAKQLPGITHFTPNVYRYGSYSDEKRTKIKGFSASNLQQINCFVFELDVKVDISDIFLACEEKGFGMPTMIIESDRGYHVYFALDMPLFINTQNVTDAGETKSLFMANRLANNIKEALAESLPVDINCNSFGFFRAPNQSNVRWFNKDYSYSLKEILNWSMDFESDKYEDKGDSTVRMNDKTKALDWVKSLMDNPNIKGEKGQYGRNNILFTIALTCKGIDMSPSETFELLNQFNDGLYAPLKRNELKTVLNSAYSGKYKGASNNYIKHFQELYGASTVKLTQGVWYKFKKERKDRVRSHNEEWENDIVDYLEQKVASGERFVWHTQKELCEAVGISSSTLNSLLKKSKKLIKVVKGSGRGSVTGWSTVAIHMSYLINMKKMSNQTYLNAVSELNVGFMPKQSYSILTGLKQALMDEYDNHNSISYRPYLHALS